MEIQIWNLKFRIQSVSAKKAEPNKQGKNKRLPVNGSPFCFGMIPAAARPCAAIDRITGRIGHLVISRAVPATCTGKSSATRGHRFRAHRLRILRVRPAKPDPISSGLCTPLTSLQTSFLKPVDILISYTKRYVKVFLKISQKNF